MFTRIFPSVVAVVDRSGIPLLTLPSSDHFIVVGGLISAVMGISKAIKGEGIDYIRIEKGIIFVKPIDEKGCLLMYFKGIDDPADAIWVVELFLSAIKDRVRDLVEGFIIGKDVEEITRIYEEFTKKLEEIYGCLEVIDKAIQHNRKLQKKARDILIKCSDGLILYENNKVFVDHKTIRSRNMGIDAFLETLKRCLREIK